LSPLGSVIPPSINAPGAVSPTPRLAALPGGEANYHAIPTQAQPSSKVELSGPGRMLSALSDLSGAATKLHEAGAIDITRERIATFVAAMNRLTQTLAISALDEGGEADALQLPDTSQISNALLQRGRATDVNADLASIGLRFNPDGNINIDSAQFARALTRDPMNTISLLSQASGQLDTMMANTTSAAAFTPNQRRVSATDRSLADYLAASQPAAVAPIPLQTARAIRSFLDIAAL
jgi:hypothetical protein